MAGGFMRSIRKLLSPSGGGGLDLPDLGMRSHGFDPPPEPSEAPRLSEAIGRPQRPSMEEGSLIDAEVALGPGSREFEGLPSEQYELFEPGELDMGVDRGLLMEDPVYAAYTSNQWADRRPHENRMRRGNRRLERALGDPAIANFMPGILQENPDVYRDDPESDPRNRLLRRVGQFEESGSMADSPSRYMQMNELALQQALRAKEMGPPPIDQMLDFGEKDPDLGYYGGYRAFDDSPDPELDRGSEPDLPYVPSRPMPSERHMRWPELLGKTLYR